MQCKDIPDAPVLEFLDNIPDGFPWGAWIWSDKYKPANSLLQAMPENTPVKLARAKMQMLSRRGLIDGCHCGCRGDYELTSKGREWLAQLQAQARVAAPLA